MKEKDKKYNDLIDRWYKVGEEIRNMLKSVIKESGTIVFDYPVRLVILDDFTEEYTEVEVCKLQYHDWGDVMYAMYSVDGTVYSVDDMRDSFCSDLLEELMNNDFNNDK